MCIYLLSLSIICSYFLILTNDSNFQMKNIVGLSLIILKSLRSKFSGHSKLSLTLSIVSYQYMLSLQAEI